MTFDESDGSQKEQVNVEILGKEEPSHQVIKKLATGEVRPVEDEDDDVHVQIPHDPNMHHGSTNVHGDASISRRGHDSREQVKRSRFSSKGKSTDTIYNVVDHESNPSHYQLSADVIVKHRRITSYKALQHWLTHILHRLI
jgi:hypothetical protein